MLVIIEKKCCDVGEIYDEMQDLACLMSILKVVVRFRSLEITLVKEELTYLISS